MLAALLSASLAVSPAAAAVKNPDTLIFVGTGDFDSFDPVWAYDTPSENVIMNVYETLLAYGRSGVTDADLEPLLATQVPTRGNGLISPDGLVYRFPLRVGVKFHDGAALTADDVRYSLLRFMLTDREGGPSSLLLEPILGVQSTRKDGALLPGVVEQAFAAVTAEGDSIVVRLKKPFAPFLSILAGFGSVAPRAWCAAHGQWDGRPETAAAFNSPSHDKVLPMTLANGTGPFKLDRYDPASQKLVLARHEGYWRAPAKLKKVMIRVVPEFATRKLMLLAGDADVIGAPQMFVTQLQKQPGVDVIDGLKTIASPTTLFFTYKINPAANPNIGSGKLDGQGIPPDFFADLDVRKAFAYAIDYQAYVRDVMRGRAVQAASYVPEELMGAADAKKPRYGFDLKMAARHLQNAWGGQAWRDGFRLVLVASASNEASQALGQMLKRNVESLNPKFHVEYRALQWSTLLEQIRQRKVPVSIGNWMADFPDPHNFAFPFLHSLGQYPAENGYSSPEADSLVEQAAAAEPPKRRELYSRLDAFVDDNAPFVPVSRGVGFRAQRSWVRGFVFRPIFPGAPAGSYYYDLYKAE
jgi:peptide/nickel transport system substrate-binding protein